MKMKEKITRAICSHLHSLLPNNKASINADGTLLEQNICHKSATGAMLWVEKNKKYTDKQDFSAIAVPS